MVEWRISWMWFRRAWRCTGRSRSKEARRTARRRARRMLPTMCLYCHLRRLIWNLYISQNMAIFRNEWEQRDHFERHVSTDARQLHSIRQASNWYICTFTWDLRCLCFGWSGGQHISCFYFGAGTECCADAAAVNLRLIKRGQQGGNLIEIYFLWI